MKRRIRGDKKCETGPRKIRGAAVFCPGPKLSIRDKNLRTRTKKYDSGKQKLTLRKCFVRVLRLRFVNASATKITNRNLRTRVKCVRLEITLCVPVVCMMIVVFLGTGTIKSKQERFGFG